jgi:hypothetical protein
MNIIPFVQSNPLGEYEDKLVDLYMADAALIKQSLTLFVAQLSGFLGWLIVFIATELKEIPHTQKIC